MAEGDRHEIIVGNVGTVYAGDDDKAAQTTFDEYVAISRAGYGRAGSEPVTWFTGGEIGAEYEPVNHVAMRVWVLVEQPGTAGRLVSRHAWTDFDSAVEARDTTWKGAIHPQSLDVLGKLYPMKSAPTDGVSILLYFADQGFIQGRYEDDAWKPLQLPWHGCHSDDPVEPDGWLPLPLPLPAAEVVVYGREKPGSE